MFGVIIRNLERTTTAGVRGGNLCAWSGKMSYGQYGVMSLRVDIDPGMSPMSILYASPVPYPETNLISHSHPPHGATSPRPSSPRRQHPSPHTPIIRRPPSQISTTPLPPPITPPHPSPPARPETLATFSPFPGLRHSVSAGLNRLSSSATAALQYTPVHVEVGRQRC